MNLKSKFKTNTKLANEGVLFRMSDCPNEDKTIPEFVIKRMSAQNEEFIENSRKSNDALLAKYGLKSISQLSRQQLKEQNLDLFIDFILVSWNNFEPNGDGVKLPYSKQAARDIFSDSDWIDLFETLQSAAVDSKNFSSSLLDGIV